MIEGSTSAVVFEPASIGEAGSGNVAPPSAESEKRMPACVEQRSPPSLPVSARYSAPPVPHATSACPAESEPE